MKFVLLMIIIGLFGALGNNIKTSFKHGNVEVLYTLVETGFDLLSVTSLVLPKTDDELFDQMYSAGYAEGKLTCVDIKLSYPNFYADNFGDALPSQDIIDFMYTNYMWMKKESDDYFKSSKDWFAVKSTLRQLDGLIDGYNSCDGNQKNIIEISNNINILRNMNDLSLMQFLLLNSWGDMYAIQTHFDEINKNKLSVNDKYYNVKDTECNDNNKCDNILIRKKRITYPHTDISRDLRCSALIKLLSDHSDILFGHTTWTSYNALEPRTMKRYVLPSLVSIEGIYEIRDNSFSSSPGVLASLDDFYIITSESSNIVVMETTNDVLTPSVIKLINPTTLLCWVRAISANNIGTSGNTWSDAFAFKHSGTYTNQWHVIDLNKFVPGNPILNDGIFTVFEEIPGMFTYKDMTQHLSDHLYWPSYNAPYFRDIARVSGNSAACKLYYEKYNSTLWCYEINMRANIFREKQSDVMDIDGLKYLLQYNEFQTDPLSLGDSCNGAISCRRDLDVDPYPSGGIDCKVSSTKLVYEFINNNDKSVGPTIYARVGPTIDNQPVFCWSNLNTTYVHTGQPDCFDYDWVAINLMN